MGICRRKKVDAQHENETDDERRKRKIRETLERHQGEDADSQAAALDHVMLAEPTQDTTDWLWKVLVVGLMVLLVVSLLGLIALAIADENYDALLTVFASALSGLLGLFVRGPAEGAS